MVALALIAAACAPAAEQTTESSVAGQSTTSTSNAATRPTIDVSDFEVGQLTTGDPISWQRGPGGTGTVETVVDFDGSKWILSTEASGIGDRLYGQSSSDGVDWADRGVILETERSIETISIVEGRLVVATGGTEPLLLTSDDGADWTASALTDDSEDVWSFRPDAVAGNEFFTVAAGPQVVDLSESLEPLVRDIWPAFDFDRYGIAVHPEEAGARVDVLGPLEFPVASFPASDLGVAASDIDALALSQERSEAQVRVQSSGGDWEAAPMTGVYEVVSIATTAQEEFIAVGWTELGVLAMWRSFDGFFWDQLDYSLRPASAQEWGDMVIGPASSGDVDLIVSRDGTEWVPLGLGNHYPRAIQWFVGTFDAVDNEIAAIVNGVGSFDSRFDFPTVERDGVQISVSPFNREILIFEEGGQEPRVWSATSGPDQEGMTFDLNSEEATFQGEDGTELTTITFSELDELAEESLESLFQSTGHYTLAHMDGSGSWTIWGLTEFSERDQITGVALLGDVVAVTVPKDESGSGFDIWTAVVP